MRQTKMKKLLLSLGVFGTSVAPIAAAVSCGTESPIIIQKNSKTHAAIVTFAASDDFKASIHEAQIPGIANLSELGELNNENIQKLGDVIIMTFEVKAPASHSAKAGLKSEVLKTTMIKFDAVTLKDETPASQNTDAATAKVLKTTVVKFNVKTGLLESINSKGGEGDDAFDFTISVNSEGKATIAGKLTEDMGTLEDYKNQDITITSADEITEITDAIKEDAETSGGSGSVDPGGQLDQLSVNSIKESFDFSKISATHAVTAVSTFTTLTNDLLMGIGTPVLKETGASFTWPGKLADSGVTIQYKIGAISAGAIGNLELKFTKGSATATIPVEVASASGPVVNNDQADVDALAAALGQLSIAGANPVTEVSTDTAFDASVLSGIGGTLTGSFPSDIRGTTLTYTVPAISAGEQGNITVTIAKTGATSKTATIHVTVVAATPDPSAAPGAGAASTPDADAGTAGSGGTSSGGTSSGGTSSGGTSSGSTGTGTGTGTGTSTV